MPNTELLSHLENIHKIVLEAQKNSEQKLISLILLNSGFLLGITKAINSLTNLSELSLTLIWGGGILLGFSLAVSVIAIMPIMQRSFYSHQKKSQFDNALFFRDIQKYSQKEYLELVSNKLDLSICSHSSLESDYANQIIVNSAITLGKFSKFKVASVFTLISFLAFGLSFLFVP